MKAKLVGKKKHTFTDKQTGEVVTNNTIYVQYNRPMVAEGNDMVDGYEVAEFGTQLDINGLKVNKLYDFDFKPVTFGKTTKLKLLGWEELAEAK